jgi:uncharacterized protein YraI
MKKTIVTAALGFGVMLGSLVGGPSVGAAPVGGAQLSAVAVFGPSACSCDTMYTTSDLNLRSGPGTSYDVLLVIPDGAQVKVGNTEELRKNGFAKVGYDDTYGWASLDYLSDVAGGGEYDTSGSEYEIVNTGFTNDSVNFRTGPDYSYAVQDVLEAGEQIAYSDVVLNGFRYVWHAGQDGWVYDQYITLFGADGTNYYEPGTTLTVTSDLNLRAEPSTSADVLDVMPEGAKVTAEGKRENGFVEVTYQGMDGWAYQDYLY